MHALRPNSTAIETWLEFLRNPYSPEMTKLAKTKPEIAQAQDILAKVNCDPVARELWRVREKAIYDEHSALVYARTEGEKIGEKRGEKGVELKVKLKAPEIKPKKLSSECTSGIVVLPRLPTWLV